MKNLRELLRRVGQQPLLIAAIIVILIGAVGAVNSYGAPATQLASAGTKKSSQHPVSGVNSTSYNPQNSVQVDQGASSPAASGDNSQSTNPDSTPPDSSTTPTSNPNPITKPTPQPPMTTYPVPTPQPCNNCTPAPGRFCPLAASDHSVIPCTGCGTLPTIQLACREPQY